MKILLPRKHIGRTVYGAILTATLLISLENYEDSAWDMIITILFTLLAVALSEYYATVIAFGFEKKEKLRPREALDTLGDSLYMFYGSLLPIAIFVAAGFGWLHLLTAFNAAELATATLLIVYGYLYGRARDHNKPKSLLFGFVNFGIVALIVALKSRFH